MPRGKKSNIFGRKLKNQLRGRLAVKVNAQDLLLSYKFQPLIQMSICVQIWSLRIVILTKSMSLSKGAFVGGDSVIKYQPD
jgi:hypothetical protein